MPLASTTVFGVEFASLDGFLTSFLGNGGGGGGGGGADNVAVVIGGADDDLDSGGDDDGDGEVGRKEFHKAMKALGLEVPKQSIDDLVSSSRTLPSTSSLMPQSDSRALAFSRALRQFSEWDKDGGGSIGYKELQKILQARNDSPVQGEKPKAAANAVKALGRITKAVKAAS